MTLCRLNPTFDRPKVGKSLYSPYTTFCHDGECVAFLPHLQIKYLKFNCERAVTRRCFYRLAWTFDFFFYLIIGRIHTEFFELAGQRVTAPAQKFSCMTFPTTGLLECSINQGALKQWCSDIQKFHR